MVIYQLNQKLIYFKMISHIVYVETIKVITGPKSFKLIDKNTQLNQKLIYFK